MSQDGSRKELALASNHNLVMKDSRNLEIDATAADLGGKAGRVTIFGASKEEMSECAGPQSSEQSRNIKTKQFANVVSETIKEYYGRNSENTPSTATQRRVEQPSGSHEYHDSDRRMVPKEIGENTIGLPMATSSADRAVFAGGQAIGDGISNTLGFQACHPNRRELAVEFRARFEELKADIGPLLSDYALYRSVTEWPYVPTRPVRSAKPFYDNTPSWDEAQGNPQIMQIYQIYRQFWMIESEMETMFGRA